MDEAASPNPSGEAAEDAAERAQLTPLIANIRSACAAQIGATEARTEPPAQTALSSECVSAMTAWKAFARTLWTQHSIPTAAQLAHLRQLGQAVRTACGWSTQDWPGR